MTTSSNFNWVKARAECSLDAVFQTIRLDVETDVETRNKCLPPGFAPFETDFKGDYIVVFRRTPAGQVIRRLEQTGNGIRVSDDVKKETILDVTLTLNDDGECRLKTPDAPDKEMQFWQFRRRALEGILFDSIGKE